MKIVDDRHNNHLTYADLHLGDVFSMQHYAETIVCMKTTVVFETTDADSKIYYGFEEGADSLYRKEFAVNLETGTHYEVKSDTVVRKLNAKLHIED